MDERAIPVERGLLYEVIGVLEAIEKADGRPLADEAGWWAGHYARRLRDQYEIARVLAALNEKPDGLDPVAAAT